DFQEEVFLPIVAVEQVAAHRGALGLPVQPDALVAVVDDVVVDDHVDGGVQLDAGHLGAGEFAPDVDVVYVVVGNGGEGPAHAAHDAGLAAVVDLVAADDVPADLVPAPAVLQGGEDHLGIGLG